MYRSLREDGVPRTFAQIPYTFSSLTRVQRDWGGRNERNALISRRGSARAAFSTTSSAANRNVVAWLIREVFTESVD